jgi:hypothetical protein
VRAPQRASPQTIKRPCSPSAPLTGGRWTKRVRRGCMTWSERRMASSTAPCPIKWPPLAGGAPTRAGGPMLTCRFLVSRRPGPRLLLRDS